MDVVRLLLKLLLHHLLLLLLLGMSIVSILRKSSNAAALLTVLMLVILCNQAVSKSKVLVIGATGRVGSAVVDKLLATNSYDVRILSRSITVDVKKGGLKL